MTSSPSKRPHIVIIGGGFAGLNAAKKLGNQPVDVTLIDKRNFHLFQPLLYQVATGSLSPADIAEPLRAILEPYKNIRVRMKTVVDIDPDGRLLHYDDGDSLGYDQLIVATGSHHHYFGNDHWESILPGLKTVEDATEMRRRILYAFERAENDSDPDERRKWLTFIVVGGGPTGVELAGALAELSRLTIRDDFRTIRPNEAKIYLLEGTDRILPPYAPELSQKARQRLEALGVEVLTNTFLTDVQPGRYTLKCGEATGYIEGYTGLWGAGVKASSLGELLARKTGCDTDRMGRMMVNPDFSIATHPEIFVIGDLAHYAHLNDLPLPGVAPVASQEGRYVGTLLANRAKGLPDKPFRYADKGNLAVIGKGAAVGQLGKQKLSGFLAWLIWVGVHIFYLVGFDNQLVVVVQWIWSYLTNDRSARLITGDLSHLPAGQKPLTKTAAEPLSKPIGIKPVG